MGAEGDGKSFCEPKDRFITIKGAGRASSQQRDLLVSVAWAAREGAKGNKS